MKKIDIEVLSGEIVRIAIDTPKLFDACKLIKNKIEEYSEQQSDIIYDLFNSPCEELKPLEDLWRLENPRDSFTIPDTTAFYKWIRLKILNK